MDGAAAATVEDMRLEVTGPALRDVGDVVRMVASRVDTADLPRGLPQVGDVLAADAVRALLAVLDDSLGSVAAELRRVALLVDVAAADYARTETRLAGPP